MKVPIHLLESLILVAEQPSMKLAAQKLNVSQPALSMQLQKLQNSFVLPLFEFKGKKKILTAFGKSVYKEARRLCSEIEFSFEGINREYLDSSNLSLRIGGRRELLIQAKQAIDFNGKIELIPMTSEQSIEALENREIDVAISRIKKNSAGTIAKEFSQDFPWLVVHRDLVKPNDFKRLAYNIDFLTSTPYLAYSNGNVFGDQWLDHLGLSFDKLNMKCIYEDWLSILKMIELGMGFSIMPDSIESSSTDVIHVELPSSVVNVTTYYLVYNKALTKMPNYQGLFKKIKSV